MEFLKTTWGKYLVGTSLVLVASGSMAQKVIIAPNTVISHSKTYNNDTLDMTHGSFIIKNNATLTISNSTVVGTVSDTNPLLINVENGNLNLNNNQVNISAVNIAPHPTTQSLQYFIQMGTGGLKVTNNTMKIDKPFTAGLLITTSTIPTSGIQVTNNNIQGFHGAVYLLGTDNALISGNTLNKNTYGNLVVIGSNSKITGNTIYFSGSNRLGDSIDVIDSNNVEISKNLILTPTCHAIYVFNSQNVTVDSNRITGGITYAMNLLTNPETLEAKDYVTSLIGNYQPKTLGSSNISVTNNFITQNRYGIAATDVDGLNVQNNTFIQRFEDNASRTFWTNNNNISQNVTNVTWINNQYKEAYTQVEGGDNSKTGVLVTFPQSGGVSL